MKEERFVFPMALPAGIMYAVNDITLRYSVAPLREK